MTEEEAIRAGAQARAAMDVIDPALSKVREAIVERLISTAPTNDAAVLRLHAAAQTVDAVRKVIMDVIANGHVAEAAVNGLTED